MVFINIYYTKYFRIIILDLIIPLLSFYSESIPLIIFSYVYVVILMIITITLFKILSKTLVKNLKKSKNIIKKIKNYNKKIKNEVTKKLLKKY